MSLCSNQSGLSPSPCPGAGLASSPASAKAVPTRLTTASGRLGLKSMPRSLDELWEGVNRLLAQWTDRFIPTACAQDPELGRRARLICRFGFLGTLFGALYAAFYLSIGHLWGSLIIVICSSGFAFMPWLMKRTGSLDIAGHALSLILTLGFSALCCLEGGMSGHAMAWLASVPLCALLMLGRQGAGRWMLASFAACAGIVCLNLLGLTMPPDYDHKWEGLVSAAGYLGFILFMFFLGVIFETGRARAFGKMQEAKTELEASNAELVRLNQEKNEFLGIAAHDLKNPLTVVIGTAGLLCLSRDPDRTRQMAGKIVAAGERMLHLIKNLLDANAIEQGRFTSNIKRCDLQALACEVIENNLPTATRKDIRLQLESDTACWAMTDLNATTQILDNLISNAVKYSPLNKTVHILTNSRNGIVEISVRDEGPGISAEEQTKLFQKFTRLSTRPTGGESSNGLGLSIVKRLAEAMHGSVRCESKPGEGATFTLQLPVA
jgi:signal transduction histidine kinase